MFECDTRDIPSPHQEIISRSLLTQVVLPAWGHRLGAVLLRLAHLSLDCNRLERIDRGAQTMQGLAGAGTAPVCTVTELYADFISQARPIAVANHSSTPYTKLPMVKDYGRAERKFLLGPEPRTIHRPIQKLGVSDNFTTLLVFMQNGHFTGQRFT